MTERVRYGPYGPTVIEIAHFLADAPYATEQHITVLHEVDRRWPGLTFRDFLGAAVLAEALAMRPQGEA
jgi:hypothetical protein